MSGKALESIHGVESPLRKKVEVERKSYEIISAELKNEYPRIPLGLSARTIRRFCNDWGIHATSRLTASQLDRVVSSSITKVSLIANAYRSL